VSTRQSADSDSSDVDVDVDVGVAVVVFPRPGAAVVVLPRPGAAVVVLPRPGAAVVVLPRPGAGVVLPRPADGLVVGDLPELAVGAALAAGFAAAGAAFLSCALKSGDATSSSRAAATPAYPDNRVLCVLNVLMSFLL